MAPLLEVVGLQTRIKLGTGVATNAGCAGTRRS